MTILLVDKIQDSERIIDEYYERLAWFMSEVVGNQEYKVVVEGGCGPGTLSRPLSFLLHEGSLYVCYDLFSGVYDSSLQSLTDKRLGCPIIQGDIRCMGIHTGSIDLVFTHELLCELTEQDTLITLKEIYRILHDGGLCINGVLSPYPETRAQELVVLADAHSSHPFFEKTWFSPPADTLAGMLHLTGFSHIHIRYFDLSLRFTGECAFDQLKKWEIGPEFYAQYAGEVETYGLELPMVQVVSCTK